LIENQPVNIQIFDDKGEKIVFEFEVPWLLYVAIKETADDKGITFEKEILDTVTILLKKVMDV